MKVYMLCWYGYEGIEYISGIFSSKEKAEEARRGGGFCKDGDINEFELDEAHCN